MNFQTKTLPVINTLNKIHVGVLTIDASTNELLLISTHHERLETTNEYLVEIEHEEHELREAIDSLNDSLGIYESLIRQNFPDEIEFVIKIQEKSAEFIFRSGEMIELRTSNTNSNKLLETKSLFEVSEKAVLVWISSAINHEKEEMIAKNHEIETAIQHSIQTIYLWSSITIIAAIMIGVFMSRYITNPIVKLSRAVNYIRQGNLETRVNLTTSDEINSLADSFNDMAAELFKNQNHLTDVLEQNTKAKLDAEQANQSKSIFLANMSHEIRTPLTSIVGFSETLLDPELNKEEKHKSISTVIQCSHHLMQIINDILDLSKIEVGKLSIESVSVDLFRLLHEITPLADMQAREKGLQFSIQYELPLPTHIISDSLRIRQILFNLVNNAIKFTEHGHIKILVRCDPENEIIYFDVIDTGIGLTKDQQQKLFVSFSQADISTTRKYGGTGLGLHLSMLLAKKLGGNIKLESVKGVGSKFTTSIATGELNSATFTSTAPNYEYKNIANKPYLVKNKHSGNVLLVDDSKNNQDLISYYLRKLGANISIADNGLKAVDMAMASHFDLILMDIQMPIMNGIEATKELRKRSYSGAIVVLSANAFQSDIEEYYEAGCNGYLKKPIDTEKFTELVTTYLTPNTEQSNPQSIDQDDVSSA